jgi:peptidoglycan hydrolase-like protein with peptidoglycan-binding domain
MGTLRNLSSGDHGPDVKAVQAGLNLVTSKEPQLGEDGLFGPKTDRAVREYQGDQGLAVDGIVGPKTRAALFPLGVATIAIFGRANPAKFKNLLPGQLTLDPGIRAMISNGLGYGVFAPNRFPALTLPLHTPDVPDFDFSFATPADPNPSPKSAPSRILGFSYDHLEVQPGSQSTFPFGGLRQDMFFLTMQTIYVRGDPDGANEQAAIGVTFGSPYNGLLANGTPWTLNPFIQLTDVDRFGKLGGFFHYWQPYAQFGIQGQGPGAPNYALTGSLYPINLGFDIGDNLSIVLGGGLAATVDLQSGKVTAGPQAQFGLTLKFGQAPKP